MLLRRKIIILIVIIFACVNNTKSGVLNFGLPGYGFQLGYVNPEGSIKNTMDIGIHADLGNINNEIYLTSFLDYWSKSYKLDYWEWSYSVSTIGLYGKYLFKNEHAYLTSFLGAGVDYQINSWDQKYIGPLSDSISKDDISPFDKSETKFGINLLGGVQHKFGNKVILYLIAKYHIGGINQFVINFGITFLRFKKIESENK